LQAACTASGVSVVNALSDWLEVEISRDGKVYSQRYLKGVPSNELTEIGKSHKTGTKVKFKADSEIFETTEYSFETLSGRLRELSFLNRGLEIVLVDERQEKEVTFFYKGGISEFVDYLSRNPLPCIPSPCISSGEARSYFRSR
jgi:DNA gyrase subunit B